MLSVSVKQGIDTRGAFCYAPSSRLFPERRAPCVPLHLNRLYHTHLRHSECGTAFPSLPRMISSIPLNHLAALDPSDLSVLDIFADG